MLYGMHLIDEIRAERTEPPAGIRTLGLDATHRWLTSIEPGVAKFRWEVDPAYANLEGAVICSWTVALADQAIFFASNSLCTEGESTRMAELQLRCVRNISGPAVTIEARVRDRVGDRMFCECDFIQDTGELAASVSALVDVIS